MSVGPIYSQVEPKFFHANFRSNLTGRYEIFQKLKLAHARLTDWYRVMSIAQ